MTVTEFLSYSSCLDEPDTDTEDTKGTETDVDSDTDGED